MGEALFTDPFSVGAMVTILIAFVFFVDRRFRIFSFFGTAILAITGAVVLVNLRVIPPSIPVGGSEAINPIYVFASDYAVPLAIVLLLMTADLGSLRRLGRPAILAFPNAHSAGPGLHSTFSRRDSRRGSEGRRGVGRPSVIRGLLKRVRQPE